MTHEAVGGEADFFDAVRSPNHSSALSFICSVPPGAAAFFAMREYEKHQAANGNPPSHAFAKELMAGIAAAEVCHHIFGLHHAANEFSFCMFDSLYCAFNPLRIS